MYWSTKYQLVLVKLVFLSTFIAIASQKHKACHDFILSNISVLVTFHSARPLGLAESWYWLVMSLPRVRFVTADYCIFDSSKICLGLCSSFFFCLLSYVSHIFSSHSVSRPYSKVGQVTMTNLAHCPQHLQDLAGSVTLGKHSFRYWDTCKIR